MKSIHDWLEFRFAETRHNSYHPNLTCHAGDDYGEQFDYSKKTEIEMKRFIALREKYRPQDIKINLQRVRVDIL